MDEDGEGTGGGGDDEHTHHPLGHHEVRPMARPPGRCFAPSAVGIISALTEFGEPSGQGNVIPLQALMAEHEGEIRNHVVK